MKLWKIYVIIIAVCFFIGILFGSLSQSSYFDVLKAVVDSFSESVVNRMLYLGKEEQILLFLKVLAKHAGPFALIWLLSNTVAGKPYIVWLCVSRGFVSGFWCCFLAMAYRLQAIKLIPLWYFPQILLYIIVFGFSVLYITENLQRKKQFVIIILSVLLIAGCIFETYINPICLSYAFA